MKLITVLGWEQRYISGLIDISSLYDLEHVYLICFKDYLYMNNMGENLRGTIQLIEELNITHNVIELEYEDSVYNWHVLHSFFNTSDFKNILLNLTTIPRETIWTILFFLKNYVSKVNYIYYKPDSYDKSEGGLTKNHKQPRLLFKHSGLFDIDKKLIILIVTGFDHNRADLLVEHFEPEKVIFLSQSGKQYENMARNSGVSFSGAYENTIIENVEFDSYDIINSHRIINELINDHENYNLIISSQGPKISAISTYMSYLDNKQLALAYVPAREFSGNYSVGINLTPISGIINF